MFSRIGVSCLQGSHQGAQKSTITGIVLDFSTTSLKIGLDLFQLQNS